LSCLNFIAFLINGSYRSLTERILGMRLIYIKPKLKRMLDFDLLNRTLIWNVLANFLFFILPFAVSINTPTILNTIKKLFIMPSLLGALE